MRWRTGIAIVCLLGVHTLHAQDSTTPSPEATASPQDDSAAFVLAANPALRTHALPAPPAEDAPLPDTTFVPDTPDAFGASPGYNFTERILNQEVGIPDFQPSVALARAIALHDIGLLESLLDNGINPNTPLPQPAPASLVNLFDDPFAKRELVKDTRVTPLILAVLTQQRDSVAVLLHHGASTEISTRAFHWYPLDFAAELKNIPIMQLLLGHEPTADGEGRHVVVCLTSQKGWLMQGQEVLLEFQVSTGRPGFDTKPGEFVITQKYTAWKSTLYKAAMPDFMRLNCSQAGLHAGYVPGVPASHGCIRVPQAQVELLYNAAHLGDRVTIVE